MANIQLSIKLYKLLKEVAYLESKTIRPHKVDANTWHRREGTGTGEIAKLISRSISKLQGVFESGMLARANS
jgi:hypothetical protein